MYKIKNGNNYNINIPAYYVESDDELNLIPSSAPAGTIAYVNELNNYHSVMKLENGSWNTISTFLNADVRVY